jgi:hypothetical protein
MTNGGKYLHTTDSINEQSLNLILTRAEICQIKDAAQAILTEDVGCNVARAWILATVTFLSNKGLRLTQGSNSGPHAHESSQVTQLAPLGNPVLRKGL